MAEVARLFPPVVHVLKGGYPMCGFTLARPEQWPAGNTWVSFLDKDLAVHATCPDCLEAHSAYKPS